MARMIPASPAHQSSKAELWLFGELRKLPEDHVVLHSLGLTHHDHKRWSEIDFVVVGPEGVFLLEVKGGVVERSNGEWFVTDEGKRKASLGRGPFFQVGGAEAATRRFLRDRLPETRTSTMGYAVVTPDCVLNLVGLDVDPATCFDASNLPSGLGSLLAFLAEHWRQRIPAQSDGLDPPLVQKVVEALCADIPGIPSLRQRMADVMAQIHTATLEQERLLSRLHFYDRVVVKGPAGSGKSTIAFNECKLRASAGQEVLYLCQTQSFADRLGATIAGHPNLEVVCLNQLRKYSATKTQVDVLVIDEAQDTLAGLRRDDLERLLRGGIANGVWRILLDPFQSLDHDADGTLQAIFEGSAGIVQSLERNVRGTIEIAVTSSAVGYIDRIEGGLHGPEVDLQYLESPFLWRRTLEIVNEWISKGIDASEILVLVPEVELRPVGGTPDAELRALDASLLRLGVTLSTPAEIKGWESAAVVYAGLRGLGKSRARREAYIACSRAQALLAIVGFESLAADIPAAYAAAAIRATSRNVQRPDSSNMEGP